MWPLVAGPTSALLASLDRIGWTMPSFVEAIDDLGASWRFDIDSPGAIATACRDSVRRWRLLKVGQQVPGLIPQTCDVGAPSCDSGTVLVDFAHLLTPLTTARGSGARVIDTWDSKWRSELVSAISGGQWPQVRKASVPAFNIQDLTCQLCMGAIGTLQHRHHCTATLPAAGWPRPPKDTVAMLERLSAQRAGILATRGLLVLRLPAPPLQGDGHFAWHVEPDPNVSTDTRWYFDGSLLNGSWKAFRSSGFGVVVTSTDGDLIGYGNGVPPHWCMTAASAEAWALRTVLAVTPFPPQMRTDCLSLLTTARAGATKATDPRKRLSRIWCQVLEILGGDLHVLDQQDTLVWMPAHQSMASVGEAKLSNGHRLTTIDWRANRLVDALAKAAASERQPPPAIERILAWAHSAVRHSAKLLARVTHAANNHEVVGIGPTGEPTSRTIRDSVDAPRQVRQQRANLEIRPAVTKVTPLERKQVRPWQPPAHTATATRRRPSQAATARAAEAGFLDRRVQDIGAALSQPTNQPTASERMRALTERMIQAAAARHRAAHEQTARAHPGDASGTTHQVGAVPPNSELMK